MRSLALLLAGLILVASGAGTAVRADWPAGAWTLQIENDKIAGTDRHYTHGTRISWVSDRSEDGPLWTRDLLHRMYPFADLRGGRIGLALGQNIFTPEDIRSADLVSGERPYAGWLYVGASVHVETRVRELGALFDMLDTVELDVGLVGPYALAEQVQNGWHEIVGIAPARGWDNQLRTEPGAMLIFERNMRPEPMALGGLEIDAVPRFGGAVGNVMTFLHAGGVVRVGQTLDVDYGPPLIRPALASLPAIDERADFAWYLFAGVDVRLVARNIFLDGNTFTESHSVTRKPLVRDFILGLSVHVERVQLSLTHVHRTREYEGQRRADRYGALSLSARF